MKRSFNHFKAPREVGDATIFARVTIEIKIQFGSKKKNNKNNNKNGHEN